MIEVSIIMATYNCADTVAVAIESILQQTCTDWEFVICDDCSTDDTYKILEKYQAMYPKKIKVIRNQANSKLPFSLNRCLEIAEGKYIARMDADDISLPERLEKQLNFLKEHEEYAVVGTSMIRFDENGDYDTYWAVENPNRNTMLREVPYCHATILMKKEAFDSLNGYVVSKRTERGQDIDLWFRFYSMGFEGNNLKEPLYKVCEDRNAIKRRRFKYCFYIVQTSLKGYNLLGYPIYKYIFAFRPIISYFIPRKFKLWIRRRRKMG